MKTEELERTVEVLARALGAPAMEWRVGKCPIGALYLIKGSKTYGRQWRVARTVNCDGAIETVLSARTKRELAQLITAYLSGYQKLESGNGRHR